MQNSEKGKILILKLHQKLFSILIRHNQILSIQADDLEQTRQTCSIGNLYVGRVQNVSANIGAAFVEIKKGVLTFLPLAEAKDAIITNRMADGTIKAGDELLVQLVKESVKTKLAGVSTRLSLSGSYVVIEHKKGNTTGRTIRVSAKLGTKYHHLYKNLEPLQEITEQFDIIIRTNAGGLDDVSKVVTEAQTLAAQMERILNIGDKRTCFSCLYQGEPEYLAFVKNCYQSEYDEIITDEKDIYETLLKRFVSPDGGMRDTESKDTETGYIGPKASNIRYYEDNMLPLYKLYSIETRLKELTDKKVWLKSGGYLVIEQTEALIAIDVNTGKYEAGKNQEETYLKINLEAAEAIARALRARNLAGVILVDFINMKKKEHMEQLTEKMKDFLRKDVVPAYVVDITGLGLMEITRKKKSKSFAEQMQNVRL